MSAWPNRSLLLRVSILSMDLAVRYWPEDSRHWGQAVLAEMGEISEPMAAIEWAAGGMLLFSRALAAQFFGWMKRPAGTGFSGSGMASPEKGPQFPKYSRLATALILLAAVTPLFLPMGQEATGTVRASWTGFRVSGGDRKELERIAAKAQKDGDARGLAFVAIVDPDATRAYEFADQAVALDPGLTWIYATQYGLTRDKAKSKEHIRKLQNYDPENALVYLQGNLAWNGRLRNPEELSKNAEWNKEMGQAFRAGKFDNYLKQEDQLLREGWKKTPTLSPGLVAMGMWRQSYINLMEAQTYADLRAKDALAAGDEKEAEASLREVITTGKRIEESGGTPFFQMAGAGLQLRGLGGLVKLYQANGQPSQAEQTEAEIRGIKAKTSEQIQAYMSWRAGIENSFRGKAIAFNISAVLILASAILTVLGLSILELGTAWGWKARGVARWIVCRIVDYGPVLFLAASAALLWTFRPIGQIYEQYRSTEASNTGAMGLFWEVYGLEETNFLAYFYEPYHQWMALTVALVIVAAVVIARGVMKRGAVAAR